MRSDLRHTVFSAARFSDILRRSYRAKPAISCFIAFAAQPGVSFPRHALYYNTRPMDKCQAIFRFILQSLFSFFSGNANFFCREPFVVILSKIPHFIPVHLRHIAVCIRPPGVGATARPPLRCRRRDAPPPAGCLPFFLGISRNSDGLSAPSPQQKIFSAAQ